MLKGLGLSVMMQGNKWVKDLGKKTMEKGERRGRRIIS
jgi:hypothetical protein